MKLSYRHANIAAGNESFLLRYQADSESVGASCILVDAGTDLDVADLLGPADELVAVCLTHAHADHYQSLGECVRTGATVYASPPTADIFGDVVDIATRQLDGWELGAESLDIQPIDGWTDIAPGVSVHPVPAGHAPGAVGYLFEFADGDDSHHALATGDFTRRRAGGYPGIDTSLTDIDVLFCTVATSEKFERNLSEGLGHALHRAHAGARTLVTTSGLFGVQVTYLLNALVEEFGLSSVIRPVGHVATLYETMGYSGRHVEPVTVFTDPTACLEQGSISVAGPETPAEGSSERLFRRLREDPNGCVVQLYHSSPGSLDTGRCTVHSYETVNHPPRDALEEVHDALAPSDTVLVHRHSGAGSEFNYLDSTVWAPTDGAEYTLYEDGWQTPPWTEHRHSGNSTASAGTLQAQIETDLTDEFTLPSITRHETADLTSEGVDLERVEAVLEQSGSTAGTQPQQHSTADTSTKYRKSTTETDTETAPADLHPGHGDTAQTGAPTTDTSDASTEQMRHTSSSTENSDAESDSEPDPDTESPHPGGTIDSVGVAVDGIDPQVQAAIDSGTVDLDELVTLLELSDKVQFAPADGNENDDEDDDEDKHESESENESKSDTTETNSEVSEERADSEPPTRDAEMKPTRDSQETDTEDPAPAPTSAREHGGAEGTGQLGAETDDSGTDTSGQGGSTHRTTPGEEQTAEIELSAFAVALAEHATDDGDAKTVVREAVPVFLEALLAGDEPSASTLSAGLSGAGPLSDTLGAVAARESGVDDVAELIQTSVTQYVGADSRTVPVPGVGPYLPLIDAVAANQKTETMSRTAVVTRAVEYYIAQQ